MSLIETVQAAKYQSFQRRNPRDLYKRIYDENPKASEETVMALYVEEIQREENRDYLITALQASAVLARNALLGRRARHPGRASASELRAQTDAIKGQIVARLLDWVMPNGKVLRSCTRSDCKRIGGFAAKLAAKVPAGKTVGEVMSEQEVRALWGKPT